MAIGETILGAVLNVVLDKLASQHVLNFFKSSKLDQSLVNELKRLMLVAGKLLADTEQKQITDSAIKEWLSDLQHLFYQAEDIANEIATEALRSSLGVPPEPQSFGNKVRNLFSTTSSSSSFANIVNSNIKDVVTQLNNMVIHSGALNLKEGSVNTESGRVPTTYLLEDTAGVFGRDQEKEELIKLFQSEEAERNRISVVAIVGMGGMGKTTLAKLVYNDDSLRPFDLKIWVYVSEQFDIFRVTKSILESIPGKSYSDSNDLSKIQSELVAYLRGKRFFLVLDDFWNEDYEQWESFRTPLTFGSQGSKIIVTTRNREVASTIRTTHVICLKPLSDEDGWSLFSKHAFVDGNSSSNAQIEFLGKKIVDKCGGLPLAIKTLGGLLWSKEDINEWEAILQSNLWKFPNNKSSIAPALRLSYYHLPSHLKRCFSYCAILSKGHEFDRKTLVLLWMAENLVQPGDAKKRIEDIGEDYLNQLLARSFFDKKGNDVVMHDLMHDLAVDVSREFVARLEEGETASKVSRKARYFSYFSDEYNVFTKFEALHATKSLRTFMRLRNDFIFNYLSKKIVDVIIPKFYCLHVLSLFNYTHLKLPESIENLKQLRYLDVSGSGIKELPESVSNLCNLQTLLLSRCYKLDRLPAHMSRLVALRHLDIRETTSLWQMPMNMGKLTCLQTLSSFVVGTHSGQGIEELRELQQIRGELALRRLQNVSSPSDALDANLGGKEYINELTLEFDNMDIDDSEKVRAVLDNLKPHANLERLIIRNYPGTRFPNWLYSECLMYNKIVCLSLTGCKHCFSLPPLGQLPSLTRLEIVGMEYIEAIGSEFYGCDTGQMNPFPELRSLVFKNMKFWKEWCGHEIEGKLSFPSLEELELNNCPELEGHLPANVCSLKLKLENCPGLKGHLPANVRSFKEVKIVGCESLERSLSLLESPSIELPWSRQSRSVYTGAVGSSLHLTRLELCGVKELVSLPPVEVGMLSCLKTLMLSKLEKLKSLENLRLPTNLQSLEIRNCEILKSLNNVIFPTNLQTLKISDCGRLKSLENVRLPTNLQTLEIGNCGILESLPQEMEVLNHLQSIRIESCPSLKRATEDTLPTSLQSLIVESCKSWEISPIAVERMQCYSSLDWLVINDIGGGALVSFPIGAFPNLRHLSLWNLRELERVYIPSGSGSDLMNLTSLQYLAIENCPKLKWIGKTEEEGVVDLPTPNLQHLVITGCGNLKPWMGDREGLLSKLQELTIDNLDIMNMNKNRNPRSLLMFSSLRSLIIDDYDGEYFPDNKVALPISLSFLMLYNFGNMKRLKGEALKTLTSLQQLWIIGCPKLQCLPEEGLPPSLGFLYILNCPLLEKRCERDTGPDWHHIHHIPLVEINCKNIFD